MLLGCIQKGSQKETTGLGFVCLFVVHWLRKRNLEICLLVSGPWDLASLCPRKRVKVFPQREETNWWFKLGRGSAQVEAI